MTDRGHSRGTRQRKHWHSMFSNLISFTANGTQLLASFTAAGGEPFTFLRGIGELVIGPSSAGIAGADKCKVTVGLGVVSADAATLGSTAMPDPTDEPDFPWLWWYPNYFHYTDASGSFSGGKNESARVRLTTKAMRKVGPRQSLVLVGQYVDIVGTPPLDLSVSMRFLIGT